MNNSRNYTDMIGGAMLIAIGLFSAIYASGRYEIGTLSEMGPGMFPTAIGYLLAGLGVLIMLPAFFRAGVMPKPDWRPFFAVIGGVLVFALTVDRIGMIPALILLTGAGVAADTKMGWRGASVLAVAIVLMAWLLFVFGLSIPIPLLRWEF